MQDLIETAMYWAETEKGDISKERFLALIGGYGKSCGTPHTDWEIVLLNGFTSKLDWLEYSLKRSLWIECTDEQEQQIGTAQTIATLKAINHYGQKIYELESWLNVF